MRPPTTAIAAPKKNADLHPYRLAKKGVSEAVRAPPIWQHVFMTPDTTPEI